MTEEIPEGYGQCSRCPKVARLKTDGTLWFHLVDHRRTEKYPRMCPGAGRVPRIKESK